MKFGIKMKPSLTMDILRDATVLAETGQPGLANDLLDRYHGTTVLRRHLLEMNDAKQEVRDATEALNVASVEFIKHAKRRRKLMEENEGKQ